MGVGSLHAQMERGLSSKLRINSVPSIVAIIHGKPAFYSGKVVLQDLRDFVRSLLPSDTVMEVRACRVS